MLFILPTPVWPATNTRLLAELNFTTMILHNLVDGAEDDAPGGTDSVVRAERIEGCGERIVELHEDLGISFH